MVAKRVSLLEGLTAEESDIRAMISNIYKNNKLNI
jgi:hypothetical protein